MNGDSLEKFRDSPLAHPDEQSVKDTGSEHHLGAQLSPSDLLSSIVDTNGGDIIGAIDEHYVHKSHPRKEWDES